MTNRSPLDFRRGDRVVDVATSKAGVVEARVLCVGFAPSYRVAWDGGTAPELRTGAQILPEVAP